MGSYYPVDIVLKTRTDDPIEGAVVKVFDERNREIKTQQVTNYLGVSPFLLYSGIYVLRFYKTGTSFQQPVKIAVPDTQDVKTELLTFEVLGDEDIVNGPIDCNYCRLSGYFKRLDGTPISGASIVFTGDFQTAVVENNSISPLAISIKTDCEGYACVDLLRCSVQHVYIAGVDQWHQSRKIYIPDRPTANLIDVIYPIVTDLVVLPSHNVEVRMGSTIETPYHLVLSSSIKTTNQNLMSWRFEDAKVAAIHFENGKLSITGLQKGSTFVYFQRRDKTITRLPLSNITPLQITVTR